MKQDYGHVYGEKRICTQSTLFSACLLYFLGKQFSVDDLSTPRDRSEYHGLLQGRLEGQLGEVPEKNKTVVKNVLYLIISIDP